MLDILLFFFFSTLEYLSIYLLMFTLFRFQIKHHIKGIIVMILVLNCLSYMFRYVIPLSDFAPIIQLVTVAVGLLIIWKISWVYSLLMTILGYGSYIVIQTLCLFTAKWLGVINSFDEFQSPDGGGVTTLGYIMQLVSVVISLFICLLIPLFRRAYTFVRDGLEFNLKNKVNKAILSLVVVSGLSITFLFYIYERIGLAITSLCLSVIIVSICTLLALSKKKDETYD